MTLYSKNFTDHDFPIGVPDEEFIGRLQAARDDYGKPMYITRGGSTLEHNVEVGGVQDSAHLLTKDGHFCAADIACNDSTERYKMVEALMAHFRRIGIYPKHIHVDSDDTKPQGVFWVGSD